mgnify:CR=1 FL=1
MPFALIVFVGLSIVVFLIYGLDKIFAILGSYRIPEKFLLLLSFVGGVGGALAMVCFRHKIRKPLFWFVNIGGSLLDGSILVFFLSVFS